MQGGWVRYLIGQENNEPVYRLCEVTSESHLKLLLLPR